MTLRASCAALAAGALGAAVAASAAPRDPWIVFAASPQHGTQPSQLFRVHASGAGLGQVTTGSRAADEPTFAPDGRRVAFARGLQGLFVVRVDGSGLRRLTGGRDDHSPVWSPDGRLIAFRRPLDRRGFRLFVVRPDGRGARLLRRAPVGIGRPSWEPTSRSLVVASAGSFYRVDVRDGHVLRRLAPGYDESIGDLPWTLSPDGRTIAAVGRLPEPPGCERAACEVFGLFLERTRTPVRRRLVDAGAWAGWSPDGRNLVYASGTALTIRPVAGGAPRRVPVGDDLALDGDAPPATAPFAAPP